jgi:hypothetical protein
VRLKYAPAASTSVALSSSNPEVTVPATLTFLPGNYGVYQNASVAAATDSDNSNDTASLSLTNVDAPSATTVGVTVTDNTIVENFGWPTYFGSNGNLGAGTAYAYMITIGCGSIASARSSMIPAG